MNVKYIKKLPTVEEYNILSEGVNWGSRDVNLIEEALKYSIFGVCAYDGDTIVGCGRVIGDKTIFLHIHDVMVPEKYQGNGIGRGIMETILNEIKEMKKEIPNLRLYLGASKGKEGFYNKFGFVERPNETLGAGMIWKQE